MIRKGALLLLSGLLLPMGLQAEHGDNIDDILLKKSSRIGRVVERKLHQLSHDTKRELLDRINSVLRLARGGDHGGGGRSFVLKFELEDYAYVAEVRGGIADIRAVCLSEISATNTGNVDDLAVEVDGYRLKLHHQGWWKTDDEKCGAITALAVQAAEKAGVRLGRKRYILSGNADGFAILGEGDSLNELKNSCLDLTDINSNVDDMSVSLSGGPIKSKHTSGWWRSTEEVCQAAVSLVF